MTKPIPWGRWLASATAIVFFGSGLFFGYHWFTLWRSCGDARATELAVFANAFGRAGTYEAEFTPKYDFTCHEMLFLRPNPAAPLIDKDTTSLEGLNAELTISDLTGHSFRKAHLTRDKFAPIHSGTEKVLPAYLFWPVRPGKYKLTLTVHDPAPKLTTQPHDVVVGYQLCGLEDTAVLFTGAISVGCLIAGAAVAEGVRIVSKRKTQV